MQAAIALCQVGTGAAMGALAGYAFSLINPIGGVVFGATSAMTGLLGNAIAQHLGANQTAVKTTLYALPLIASLVAGMVVTTAVGFPITVMGAIGLTLAIAVTSYFVHCLAIGGVCCGAAGLVTWMSQNNSTTVTT